MRTVSAAQPALPANSSSDGAESQVQATPPWTRAVSSSPPAAKIASAPGQSTRERRTAARSGPRCGSAKCRTISQRATAPTGTLIRKIHRHPAPAASSPPSAGPATDEAAQTLESRAWILGRSRIG